VAEARLLPRVQVICGVSGGSIAAGILIDRWDHFVADGADENAFRTTIDGPLREYITRRSLRNEWLVHATFRVPRARGRGVVLGTMLSEHLLQHRFVADLPAMPQVVFTATELNTGRDFRIARDFIGGYDYGYVEPTPRTIELGTAIAASAAFPASLSVVQLPADGLSFTRSPRTLSLVDGGVYDNLGLEWFQGWDSGRPKSAVLPEFLIVVNASSALTQTDRRYSWPRALVRDVGIQFQQTMNLRVRWLIDEWHVEQAPGVYVGIGHDPRRDVDEKNVRVDPRSFAGALPSDLVLPLAQLRTDLDRFTHEEAELLSYHAYWSLHARLKTFRPEFALDSPTWHDERLSHMSDRERDQVIERLRRGAQFRLRR
jgi:predicted acylesterase/phospholipase RssA